MPRTVKTNCPFTLKEYRQLLRLARTRFPVIRFDQYRQQDSYVLWRHDVEYSVEEMHRLAAIDAEEGVRSTFFVHLHSDFYHFWDTIGSLRIREWVRWGHMLGLHFDPGCLGVRTEAEYEVKVREEATLLERVFETPIRVFAYHNPNPEILRFRGDYAGLINTYNEDFQRGDIVYVSDSNGRWRQRTIRDVLEDAHTIKAQINTHDTWWTDERIPQIAKLERAMRGQAEARVKLYRSSANVVVEDII